MVWHRTSPASATTWHWQDRRKLPLRCRSNAVGSESAWMPSVTSTTHSLHFPCLRQEGGTRTSGGSAWSNRDSPGVAGVERPLMVRVTAIYVKFLPAAFSLIVQQ